MKNREILIRGDYTVLEIAKTEEGYFITAYGDGEARLEISELTFEMIVIDYEYGVEKWGQEVIKYD